MPLKTVLITGCGPSGIGSALAREFRRRGHTVFATGRTAAEIDPEPTTLGCDTFLLDVTSQTSIEAATKTVAAATNGGLDILINNAGMLHFLPFADMGIADVRQLFEVNVIAAWAMAKAFLPLLIEAKGMVATISFINAQFCPPLLSSCNSSKAAIEAIGHTIRRELAPLGVGS
jgi:1-acylglycerone phosphate reductase